MWSLSKSWIKILMDVGNVLLIISVKNPSWEFFLECQFNVIFGYFDWSIPKILVIKKFYQLAEVKLMTREKQWKRIIYIQPLWLEMALFLIVRGHSIYKNMKPNLMNFRKIKKYLECLLNFLSMIQWL